MTRAPGSVSISCLFWEGGGAFRVVVVVVGGYFRGVFGLESAGCFVSNG